MNLTVQRWHRRALVLLLPVLSALLAGCQYIVNPFNDEMAGRQRTTTPSVQAARAAQVEVSVAQPHGEPKPYPAHVDEVTHLPLYFEDPFEDKGSEDGKFAWTGEDYLWMFYSRGRFLLNAVAFPLSAAVTPPWTPMASDGRLSRQCLGYDHDARRMCCKCADSVAPHAADGS